MAKKNNIAITFEGMTSARSNMVMLEMLNSVTDSNRFEYKAISRTASAYMPLFDTTVKSITLEDIGNTYNVNIALRNGATLYGKAVHLNRSEKPFDSFTIYEVELPRF